MQVEWPRECLPFLPRNWDVFSYEQVMDGSLDDYIGIAFCFERDLAPEELLRFNEIVRRCLEYATPSYRLQGHEMPSDSLLVTAKRDQVDHKGFNYIIPYGHMGMLSITKVKSNLFPEHTPVSYIDLVIMKTIANEVLHLQLHALKPGIHYERALHQLYGMLYRFTALGLIEHGEPDHIIQIKECGIKICLPKYHIAAKQQTFSIPFIDCRKVFNKELGLD